MKINYLFGAVLFALLVACGSDKKEGEKGNQAEIPSAEELLEGIKVLEDSLMTLSQLTEYHTTQIPRLTKMTLIEKELLLYRAYPDHAEAATCLDKVHMLYSSLEAYELSSQYADTLLMKYPKYKERLRVIEGQISNYDMFIKPWNQEKVKYYYKMLQKEYPNLPQERKDDIQFRLDNIDLSLDQLIEKQMKEIE